MAQQTVAEDHGTPIFDALAAEIGLELDGRSGQTPDPDAAPDG